MTHCCDSSAPSAPRRDFCPSQSPSQPRELGARRQAEELASGHSGAGVQGAPGHLLRVVGMGRKCNGLPTCLRGGVCPRARSCVGACVSNSMRVTVCVTADMREQRGAQSVQLTHAACARGRATLRACRCATECVRSHHAGHAPVLYLRFRLFTGATHSARICAHLYACERVCPRTAPACALTRAQLRVLVRNAPRCGVSPRLPLPSTPGAEPGAPIPLPGAAGRCLAGPRHVGAGCRQRVPAAAPTLALPVGQVGLAACHRLPPSLLGREDAGGMGLRTKAGDLPAARDTLGTSSLGWCGKGSQHRGPWKASGLERAHGEGLHPTNTQPFYVPISSPAVFREPPRHILGPSPSHSHGWSRVS